jgi:hypothetical protein
MEDDSTTYGGASLRARLAQNSIPDVSPTSIKKRNRLINRLEKLIAKAEDGEDIANRDIQNAVPDGIWADYQNALSLAKATNEQAAELPAELADYFERIKSADFLFARAEHTKVTPRSKIDHSGRPGRQRLYAKAEAKYERALERLQEILSVADAKTEYRVRAALDRDVDFTPGKEPTPDNGSVPRRKHSRSIQSGLETPINETRRALKLRALQAALGHHKC